MGASSSSVYPSTSIPAKERQTERHIDVKDVIVTNDNERQKPYNIMNTCNINERQSQNLNSQSVDQIFNSAEFRNQRPTTSCSDVQTPKRDTLLTYAAQMTGWQTVENHNQSVNQQNIEVMELLRIVSQLAMANHQLANAHNATLTRMEANSLEVKRPISMEDLETVNDIVKKRLQEREDIEVEKMQRLEQRVIRLEDLLTESSARQCKRINLEEVHKLYPRVEKLENLLQIQEMKDNNHGKCSSPEQWISHVVIDTANKVPEDDGDRQDTIKETIGDNYKSDHTNFDHIERNENVSGINENMCSGDIDLRLDKISKKCATSPDDQQTSIKNLVGEEIFNPLREIEDLETTQHGDTNQNRLNTLPNDENVIEKVNGKNVKKSIIEEEQIDRKISKLRLNEKVTEKKDEIETLEDTVEETQRLKEIIKTERTNDDIILEEDIETIDSIDMTENATDRVAISIEEFKKELILKREARQRGIAAITSEMERLRQELNAEKEAHCETLAMLAVLRSACSNSRNQKLTNEDDEVKKSLVKEQKEEKCSDENEKVLKRMEAQRLTNTLKVSDELRNDVRYQIEKMDDLRYHLETDPERHQHRVRCLTEVTNKARESLGARQRLTNQLKNYLAQVLVRLGDRNFLEVRDDTGAECDRQLENINTLKTLYNERLRVLSELKDSASKELMDVKQKLEHSLKMSESLTEELRKAEEKVDVQDSEIINLESQLGLTKADCRDLQNQMSLINGLFTQMLLGASSSDMDLDRLTQLLQENHDLISDIAKEESTEAAALPKLLLDLIEQVEGGKTSQKSTDETNENICEIERKEDDLQGKDIAHNLPKVWRVLLELLSCHAVNSPNVSVAACSDPNSCYKSIDTPTGPTLVISVSKTYIRLKELILEKKHLEKEMNRMKQLNTHLESKLGEQEKRLSMVSVELTKTWNIVGRMQAQHQQLHTHEQILRYELQQKRNMLQELKQELEYCKEKWESARQKNTNTELEWRNLRREFAARKALAVQDSFNNSAESGFSDERGDDTDEEEETIEERIRYGPRRRTRKESPRAPTPDTESEQPTDTELSESKTSSSMTLEQRTPTPETEAELDDVTDVHSESINIAEVCHITGNIEETLNPLDEALTNVIQNLIRINDGELNSNASILEDSCDNLTPEDNDNKENHITISKPDLYVDNSESVKSSSIMENNSSRQFDKDGEIIKSEITLSSSPQSSMVSHVTTTTAIDTVDIIPVFSIGPYPTSTVTPSPIKSVQFSDPLIVGPSNRFFAPVFGTSTIELENYKDNSVASSSSMLPDQDKSLIESKENQSTKSIEITTDSDSVSIDSSSSLDTVRELSVTNINSSSSSTSISEDEQGESAIKSQKEAMTVSAKFRTSEEVLAARADRLKRLEEQANWLVKKMNATNQRGSALCTRLEELHEVYGEPPIPPPMPDVLPSYRLPSSLSELPHQELGSTSLDDNKSTEDKNSGSTKDDAFNVK